MISAPQPLSEAHQVANFDCGEPSLDDWLKRRAAKNQANGSSRTYVVCDGEAVIGYYCLAAGAIGHSDAPSPMTRNRPDPIPVLVLGRLAIHRPRECQQKTVRARFHRFHFKRNFPCPNQTLQSVGTRADRIPAAIALADK